MDHYVPSAVAAAAAAISCVYSLPSSHLRGDWERRGFI